MTEHIKDLRCEWTKRDDRRNKEYGSSMEIILTLGGEHGESKSSWGATNYIAWYMQEAVNKSDYRAPHWYSGKTACTFNYHYHSPPAAKPSEILSLNDLILQCGGMDFLKAEAEAWMEQAIKYRDECVQIECVNQDANRVIRHFTSVACKDATRISRYEQKMAAIQAEYAAEVGAQIDQNINDWKAQCLKDDTIVTEAIPVAMKALKEHAVKAANRTGIFRGTTDDPVNISILRPEEWIDREKEKLNADAAK